MLNIDNIPFQVSPIQKKKILDYYDAFIAVNSKINVTSRVGTDHLTFHFIDSIICSNVIRSNKKIVDFGSGGGLPGIILSILNPGSVTLVESKRKKREFLHDMKNRLNLDNLVVFDGDVQMYAKSRIIGNIDCFTAKAFAKPLQLIKYLRLFNQHVTKRTVCCVPISRRQLIELNAIVPCETRTIGADTYHYMMLDFQNIKRYKVDLEAQYNL